MRNRWNQLVLGGILTLTVFSILVVWPGWPKRYLPDFIDYPEGPLLDVGPNAMKLGLDLKGGAYVLTEADTSALPAGTSVDDAMDVARSIIENRVNKFGVSETEVTREGKNRLAVQLPGIAPEEAASLIGKTALLEFREPTRDDAGKIVCVKNDGSGAEFAVEPNQTAESTGDKGVKRSVCNSPSGETGEVKWKPAVGVIQGQARVLTGRFLKAGALPVPLHTIQTSEVDATLGETTLVRSVQAGMIGILAVMVFMILYYRLPGVLASLALVTYISTLMMIFKLGPLIGPVTITLAGIAGFVLSVGMAVDANILVFERMKEELRGGRALPQAIEHGFDRAWSSIRDSNVSTLITCGILWWFGDQFGANLVKGFALTLGLGVLISMFSAIIVTRTLLRLLVGTPLARNMALFAPDLAVRRVAAGTPFIFDFVRRRGFYFLLSGAILVPGVISLIVPPALKAGIEFSSGATMTIAFDNANISDNALHDAFTALGHSEARGQKTSNGSVLIRRRAPKGPTGAPAGAGPPSA